MNPQRSAAINKLVEIVGEWAEGRRFCSYLTPLSLSMLNAYDELMRAPLDDPGPPKTRTAAPLTSHWAARSIDNKTVAGKILRYLYVSGDRTVDEIEQGLGMRHQSASARVNELRDCGWIVALPQQTRSTRSGRQAECYTLTARGRELLMEVRYG